MSNESSDQGNPNDAYLQLGITADASFEEIQKARDKKLLEAGEDLLLKAKIESSYDSLLMNSLKARQLGKVSNEAVNASQKEKNGSNVSSLGGSLLTRIGSFGSSGPANSGQDQNSFFNFPEGEGLTIRLSLGFLILVLLLVAPDKNIQFILSISTIGLFISQIKRGKKILSSLGWSVVFLSCGYILGGLLISSLEIGDNQAMLLSLDKLEALPAVILLWIGSLVLA